MDTTEVTKDLNRDVQASSDAIKMDIDRTRQRMDATISELGDRLRPKNIISDVVDYVRCAPSSDGHTLAQDAQAAAKAVLHQVKLHPMPALLLTAGVAWLVAEQRKKSSYAVDYELRAYPVGTPSYGPGSAEWAGTQPSWQGTAPKGPGMVQNIKDTTAKVGEKLAAAGESVKSTAASVKDKIGSATQATIDTGRDIAARTGDVLNKAKEQAQLGYQVGREGYRRGAENYPLPMGIGCLALGTLVGFMLPRTQREDELLGDASAQLRDKAMEVGTKVLEQTKEVAADVADKVADQAKSQGLTPSNLVEKVTGVVSTAGQAIKEKVLPPQAQQDKPAAKPTTGGPQTSPKPAGGPQGRTGPDSACGCNPV